MQAYDIAIIGLGPAGSIFATHLNKRFKAIALDKKMPLTNSGFCKPCGGLLAPDAQRALSRFNMTLPKEILVDPQIFSVRTIDIKSGLTRHYQRHYINLDRHKFDMWLVDNIPDHIEIQDGAACTDIIRENSGGFRISYIAGSKTETIWAPYIVGADGANSIVRRKLFKNFKIHKYLSIQQWFADAHDTPFYSCIFDPVITDSYAWGLTKDEHFIFGGAFNIKTGKQDFELMKQKLAPFGFQLENPVKTEACLVLRPFGARNYCYGGEDAFLIGEAAGFISPSSLEGISYAIDSGYLLSQCFNKTENNDSPFWQYRRGTRKIRLKLLSKYLKRPFIYHPMSRKIVMKTGMAAIKIHSNAKIW